MHRKKKLKNIRNKRPKNVVKDQNSETKPKNGARQRLKTCFQNTKIKEALRENCKKTPT